MTKFIAVLNYDTRKKPEYLDMTGNASEGENTFPSCLAVGTQDAVEYIPGETKVGTCRFFILTGNKTAFGDSEDLTKEIHQEYREVLRQDVKKEIGFMSKEPGVLD